MTLKEAHAMLKKKQSEIVRLKKELVEARRHQAFASGTQIRIIGLCEIISGPDSDGDYEVSVGSNENEINLSRDEFEVIE